MTETHIHDFKEMEKEIYGENIIGVYVMCRALVYACLCGYIDKIEEVLETNFTVYE